ncbi:MAG TPA: hypothetical protein VKM72_06300 [Thermoanaerobaculia bacterium]|nr:hypothetical protein [Thermoanaerobaculia bacterium]
MNDQHEGFRAQATGYLLLMAYLVLVKLAITFVPDAFRSTAQAAVFAWPMIAVLTVLGLGGLWLARRVGLPGLWNPDLPALNAIHLDPATGTAYLFTGLAPAAGLCRRVVGDCGELY